MTQLRCQIYLSVRLTTIYTTSNLFITVLNLFMKFCMFISYSLYSQTRVKWQHSKRPKIGFQDQLLLNAGQKHCRMLILQYFRPSLSYYLSLTSLFCLFLSARFTQVLLYGKAREGNCHRTVLCIPYLLKYSDTLLSYCTQTKT